MLLRMRTLFLLVFAAMCGCQSAPQINQPANRFDLYVLGRAQDGGLPHVGCEKACCVDARRSGRVETPACLGIHDRETDRLVLIEATPAIEEQLALFAAKSGVVGRGRQPVDAILITHAHIGHYAGLIQLGREVASTQHLPTYVTPRMASFLRTNGPWSQLVDLGQLDLIEVDVDGAMFEPIEGLRIEAIAVPHREEFSDTVAFRVHGPTRTVLFCPDVDRWAAHDGLLERLIEGVDVAYLDGTFYDGREVPGRDLSEIPHPAMIDTMRRLKAIAAQTPGKIRFIHLNHTNPAWNDSAIRDDLERRGFQLAVPGERVGL